MLGFARLLDEIGSYASAEELMRLAGERVDALLEPESIAVYARADGAASLPCFTRGRAKPTSFEADSLLVRALEQRGRPLWADASELDAFDRAALETLGVELIVPIRGREGVVAFACLGRKRSGDIYTPQEVAHLGAVANRCSEVLLRLTAGAGGEEPGRRSSGATGSSGRSRARARRSVCATCAVCTTWRPCCASPAASFRRPIW